VVRGRRCDVGADPGRRDVDAVPGRRDVGAVPGRSKRRFIGLAERTPGDVPPAIDRVRTAGSRERTLGEVPPAIDRVRPAGPRERTLGEVPPAIDRVRIGGRRAAGALGRALAVRSRRTSSDVRSRVAPRGRVPRRSGPYAARWSARTESPTASHMRRTWR